ncbi:MAG: hypothetical protein KKG75_01390 [Nanoarchaeota archaeon]|nr:hypothetical protein [Nanoarchaeota archaeon]
MVNGMNVKCRNCLNKFWVELKLSFGVRQNKNNEELLNCFLNEVRFYFKCPYCKQDTIVNAVFFNNKLPEISQITENPKYIG